jgi:large subunit ribosomal protein L5
MSALQQKFVDEIRPALKDELGIANVMRVPAITKITLNMGVGEAVTDKQAHGGTRSAT